MLRMAYVGQPREWKAERRYLGTRLRSHCIDTVDNCMHFLAMHRAKCLGSYQKVSGFWNFPSGPNFFYLGKYAEFLIDQTCLLGKR